MASRTHAKKYAAEGQRKLSQLETLKLYEDFKDFRKYMYRAIDKMPRWIKCTEGSCVRRRDNQALEELREQADEEKDVRQVHWMLENLVSIQREKLLASVNSYLGQTRHFSAYKIRERAMGMLFGGLHKEIYFTNNIEKMAFIK